MEQAKSGRQKVVAIPEAAKKFIEDGTNAAGRIALMPPDRNVDRRGPVKYQEFLLLCSRARTMLLVYQEAVVTKNDEVAKRSEKTLAGIQSDLINFCARYGISIPLDISSDRN